MKRSPILALSVLVSLVFHGLLLLMAPNIQILHAAAQRERVDRLFRVRVLPLDKELPRPQPDRQGPAGGLGALRDILREESPEALAPGGDAPMAELPEVEERLAALGPEREYAMDLAPEALLAADAKLLEIAASRARKGIDVPRRLVRPSSDRLLPKDVSPVLRTPGEESPGVPLPLPQLSSTAGTATEPGHADGPLPVDAPPPQAFDSDAAAVRERVAHAEREIVRQTLEKAAAEEPAASPLDGLIDVRLDTFVDPADGQGYFRVRLQPRESGAIEPLPKDVTLMVDASRSIAPRKLESTIDGAVRVIERMNAADRFNVVAFSDAPSMFQPETVPATPENKTAAKEFLQGLRSRGETDVYAALSPVMESPRRPGLPGMVLMLSDGHPTTGLRDTRTLINTLSAENERGHTVITFSGGNTVNRPLLDMLAYRNKGAASVAPSIESMDEDLPRFFQRFERPVLVDCRADFGRLDESSIVPRQLPDVYVDQPVEIYGRFDPQRDNLFAMRLEGEAGGEKHDVVFTKELAHAETGTKAIARDWAFSTIYALIGEMTRKGETPALQARVRELSKRYNIKTPFN